MSDTLSPFQWNMLLASGPDDITGTEGAGVELRSGADYAVAKALERHGLGRVEGPGGPLCGLYFNNADGLTMRADELRSPEDDYDPDYE